MYKIAVSGTSVAALTEFLTEAGDAKDGLQS